MRLPVFMRGIALLIFTALITASCTGFPRGWSAAKTATATDAISGAWIGRWHSETNGHSGGLRCVAARRDADAWHFRYRASWAKILCAGFSMDAAVKPDKRGGYAVSGSKDLGKMFGGLFTSSGTIKDGSFHARYESKFDRGTMEMRRMNTAGVETTR